LAVSKLRTFITTFTDNMCAAVDGASSSRIKAVVLFLILAALSGAVDGQTLVQDVFGRALNQHGLTLVDWDGYMANPLIKFYVFPPTNAVLPGTAVLSVNGPRLYFDTPCTVSSSGPTKSLSFSNSGVGVPARVSIFPDRDGVDEDYTLTIVFTGANNAKQTNTVPIHVLDLDLQRTNDFVVTTNFDRDVTGAFTNKLRRQLTKQAADDWSYFFAAMNLDSVGAGQESTYIWSNNFNGGYYFNNTNLYTGYLLYAYGTTNSTHVSGGEGSYAGHVQTAGGVSLAVKRSGGFESEIFGNYNTLGWLFLTNDNDWLVTGNPGNETNDFYSIAHHEIGHALIFNEAHPGFAAVKTSGGFQSATVTNYYGGPVPVDSSDHLSGAIDPESGQGAFGYEYYGSIPRKRWVMTKLDLLCAQEVGYVLRNSAALRPFSLPAIDPPPAAAQTVFYSVSFSNAVFGGIPIYNWDIMAGSLPPGLTLDPFTGTISGIPKTNGTFNISLRARDYRENSAGFVRSFPIIVHPPPPVQLSVNNTGPAHAVNVVMNGATGQRQVLQVSPDLFSWFPIATNTSGTNIFEFTDLNTTGAAQRFYRAVVLP
jgi:hypothetical protein